MLPDKPSFEITNTEKVPFVDTIGAICPSLGLWFGFSIHGVEMSNLSELFNKKNIISCNNRIRNISNIGNMGTNMKPCDCKFYSDREHLIEQYGDFDITFQKLVAVMK